MIDCMCSTDPNIKRIYNISKELSIMGKVFLKLYGNENQYLIIYPCTWQKKTPQVVETWPH